MRCKHHARRCAIDIRNRQEVTPRDPVTPTHLSQQYVVARFLHAQHFHALALPTILDHPKLMSECLCSTELIIKHERCVQRYVDQFATS